MAMSRLCGLLALLCAVALLSSASAEELSPADAIIEARNDEAVVDLSQAQVDKVLADSLPAKSDLSESPAIIPVVVEEKIDEEQSLPAGEGSMKEEENASVDDEDSKKESLELAMNADILNQPEMARLARHLKSFHNYQLYRAQKVNGVQRSANDIEDDGVVPEERAVRRRKRVYKRKANNNVRRVHRRKNVANRQNSAHRQNQRLQSVRRRNSKNSATKRRRGSSDNSYRRGSSGKKQRNTSSSSKRRSTSKNSSRKTKGKSSLKKRSKNDHNKSRKHVAYEQDEEEPAQIQAVHAPQMIVILDGDKAETAYVAQAA